LRQNIKRSTNNKQRQEGDADDINALSLEIERGANGEQEWDWFHWGADEKENK